MKSKPLQAKTKPSSPHFLVVREKKGGGVKTQ